MSKIHSGSAIPRHFLYVTDDGAFVVQLSEILIQDLLSGEFQDYSDDGFGHAITDYELNQLKAAGRVEDYNRNYVWLFSLPEPHRYNKHIKTQERVADRVRTYYINTMLPKSKVDIVQALLKGVSMTDELTVYVRGDQVAISGKNGDPFSSFKDAENLQRQLVAKAQHMFKDSAIAFTEVLRTAYPYNEGNSQPGETTADLATIIASQTDTSRTKDLAVVLLITQAEEQSLVQSLCVDMKMNVRLAAKGSEALELLEDGHSDLLIMDLQLPDMHGWAMLGKLKEISSLRELPVIVMAEASAANQNAFALTVAKVDVYLVKPISKARLRQNIWLSVQKHPQS